jgi:hypothetical protein
MPRLRYRGPDDDVPPRPQAIPFSEAQDQPEPEAEPAGDATSEALDALESVSRRMEDLARALDCLGYFDDDDRPRAA